jgi:hypothetical protein
MEIKATRDDGTTEEEEEEECTKKSVEGSSEKNIVEELRSSLAKRRRKRNRRKHAPRSKKKASKSNSSIKEEEDAVAKPTSSPTTTTKTKRLVIKQLVPERLDYFSALAKDREIKTFVHALKQKAPSSSYRTFILKKLVPKLATVACTGYRRKKNSRTRTRTTARCDCLREKWTSSPWRKPLTWRRKDWRQEFVSITPRRRRYSRIRFSSSSEKVQRMEANSPSRRLWRKRGRFWGRDKSYPALRRCAGKSKLKERSRTERN